MVPVPLWAADSAGACTGLRVAGAAPAVMRVDGMALTFVWSAISRYGTLARTSKPPLSLGPACTLPWAIAIRSLMPCRPNPGL